MKILSIHIRKALFRLLCCFAIGLLVACNDQSAEPASQLAAVPVASAPSTAQACQQLAGMTFTAESIGLPITGGNVISSELIAATATDNPNNEYCKVLGAILPVDPTAPTINFE